MSAPAAGWRAAFPPAQWLASYERGWLRHDAIAGLTLAAYSIPVSLAYATLAGLPPQAGIYAYLAGGLAYALFGSSRQLAVGPTSSISMLVGATAGAMAAGDAQRWAEIAALTALVVAVMSLLAWALRLSSLVAFISETILLGFKAGAALTIALTQLPKLFGVAGGGDHFFERLVILGGQLPETNLLVLAFGLIALGLILAGEKLLPGRPVPLGVMALAIVVLSVTPLSDRGFAVVGDLPSGLPGLEWPSVRLRDVDGVLPLAFACLLLAYVEGVAAARTLAYHTDAAVDRRQELLGLGAANLAASFSHGFPVAGGLSQSSVNARGGAKTPLALVCASAAVALCLTFLTGLLRNLPTVVLAAIVLVAVAGLINLRDLRHLRRVSRFEFTISMVAFGGVLVLGILKGVVLASVVSLLLLIARAARPHVAFLGRIAGFRGLSDMARDARSRPVAGLLAFRVDASLLYFNVEHVHDTVWARIRSTPGALRLAVCDLSTSPHVDLAGARMLGTLDAELRTAGIDFRVVGAPETAWEALRAEGLDDGAAGHRLRMSAVDVLGEFDGAARTAATSPEGEHAIY